MSDIVSTSAALRNALSAGFAALPIFWGNDPGEGPTLADAPNGYVMAEIHVQDEELAALGMAGQRVHRDYGTFDVYICVPAGTKIGTAEAYAQQIRAIFKVGALPDIDITRRTIPRGELINPPQGRMWCVPVVIEWTADRTE